MKNCSPVSFSLYLKLSDCLDFSKKIRPVTKGPGLGSFWGRIAYLGQYMALQCKQCLRQPESLSCLFPRIKSEKGKSMGISLSMVFTMCLCFDGSLNIASPKLKRRESHYSRNSALRQRESILVVRFLSASLLLCSRVVLSKQFLEALRWFFDGYTARTIN